jgi:DNA modification methylase
MDEDRSMSIIDQIVTDRYTLAHGDCVEFLRGLPDASIGYSIFSPPFASLYTYSNSPRDMGNVRNDEEFFAHFDFLVAQLRRVIKPGRNVSFHCMDMPASKERDGYIGLKDFPGDLLRAFQKHGFIFHSKVTIWKDPVTAMQRTKALGLLHKSIRENSAMCRQGIPDYLITVRAPGESERITHGADLPVDLWQRYASPVWMDINPSETLQYMSAREHDDERHICPLQLDVIRRGIHLWTNRDDIVLSPFTGIGSEGYCALEMGRRFVGAELKKSYFDQAAKNLAGVMSNQAQDLFAGMEA